MKSNIEELLKNPKGERNDIFPVCIGYGVLDERKMRTEYPEDKNGEPIIEASYLSYEGELVYKVRLTKESCYVEEFFEGKVVGITTSPTLKGAFLQRFLSIGENTRFRKMIQRITADENVVLVPPGQDGFRSVCFPEGLNFVLRLPVVPYDRITEIESHLRDISIHVDILGIYGGQVITTGQGRLIHYFARFVDFSATLWHLEETLNFIHDEGLVPPYPQLGLYILDPLDAAPGSFKVYLGEEGTRMEGYAFLLDRPGDIHVIEAEEIITSAVNPMKKVRKKLSTQSKANVDPGRGIYRGVISQNSIMEEAMDDFSFDYEKPHCPKCGREVSADPLEQYDFLCTRCNHGSRAEDAYPDRPLGFLYDAEGYFLTNCADGDILVLRSNFYTLAQLSSSHEPGAGNLEAPVEDGVKTYCLGHDWFEGGIAPYPVYRVSDDVQIVGAKVEMVYDSEDTDMVKQSNHGF